MSTGTLIRKVVSATATKGTTPGTHVFVLSTRDVDRDGDRLDPNGWDLTPYQDNPVVLYGHDAKSLPIGRCPDIRVVGGQLKGVVEWPPVGIYPFADTCKGLVDTGFLRSASVGFRPGSSSPNAFGGRDYDAVELIEWSVVNIGSNPSALLERGVPAVMQKWLKSGTGPQKREDNMNGLYLELADDEPVFELIETKDRSLFEIMCDEMLSNYSEMDSEKFRELMARQLALLGPAASIVDLVHALAQQGVAAPRSAPGFRHLSLGEQINQFNKSNQQYERDKDLARADRWHRPSFSMY